MLKNITVAIILAPRTRMVRNAEGKYVDVTGPEVRSILNGEEYMEITPTRPSDNSPVIGPNVYRLLTIKEIQQTKGISRNKASELRQNSPLECVAGPLSWKDLGYVGASEEAKAELKAQDKKKAQEQAELAA